MSTKWCNKLTFSEEKEECNKNKVSFQYDKPHIHCLLAGDEWVRVMCVVWSVTDTHGHKSYGAVSNTNIIKVQSSDITLFRIVGQFESQGLKLPYFQFVAVFLFNFKFPKGLKSKRISIPFDLSHVLKFPTFGSK